MALDPIDVDALLADGSLRQTVRGRIINARKEGRQADIITEVAAPILDAAIRMMEDPNQGNEVADDLVAHAFHDGLTPTQLMQGMDQARQGRPEPGRPAPVDPSVVDVVTPAPPENFQRAKHGS